MAESAYFLFLGRLSRPEMMVSGMTQEEAKAMERHRLYLRELRDRGVVVLAGHTPIDDVRAFRVVIVKAPSETAARRVMEEDPAALAGVIDAELFPFDVGIALGGPEIG
jgi:uncharacterized protein YciI